MWKTVEHFITGHRCNPLQIRFVKGVSLMHYRGIGHHDGSKILLSLICIHAKIQRANVLNISTDIVHNKCSTLHQQVLWRHTEPVMELAGVVEQCRETEAMLCNCVFFLHHSTGMGHKNSAK